MHRQSCAGASGSRHMGCMGGPAHRLAGHTPGGLQISVAPQRVNTFGAQRQRWTAHPARRFASEGGVGDACACHHGSCCDAVAMLSGFGLAEAMLSGFWAGGGVAPSSGKHLHERVCIFHSCVTTSLYLSPRARTIPGQYSDIAMPLPPSHFLPHM